MPRIEIGKNKERLSSDLSKAAKQLSSDLPTSDLVGQVNTGSVVPMTDDAEQRMMIENRSRAINFDFDKNSNFLDYVSDLVAIQKPCDLQNAGDIAKAFSDYIAICKNYGIRPRNQSLLLACGFDQGYYSDVLCGVYDNPELINVMLMIQKVCATAREDLMEQGKLNAQVGLQWQKLYDGLDIRQDIVNHTVKHDIEKIASKYDDYIVVDS